MTSEEDTTTKSSSSPLSALQDNIETKGKNSYYFAHAHKANGPKWDGRSEPRLLVKHSDSNLVVVGESETVDQNNNNNNNNNNTIDANMEQNISNHAQSLIKSLKEKKSSFDFSKSTITKYAFIDEGKKVKLYIDLKGVGDVCNVNEDVTLDWDERSFSLKVLNYVVPATTTAMAVKEGDGEGNGEGKDNTDNDNSREKGNDKDVQCLSFGRLHGFISKAAVKVKKDRIIVTLWKKVDEESEDDPEDWPQIAKKGDGEDY